MWIKAAKILTDGIEREGGPRVKSIDLFDCNHLLEIVTIYKNKQLQLQISNTEGESWSHISHDGRWDYLKKTSDKLRQMLMIAFEE